MPNPGTIDGTHHLTFCVGGAQEDYDFHVRTLGLKSVKKTVLFDGEIPIYHLYYANRVGDASTILTAFPYRQAGWMGKRGTNQAKSINARRAGRVDRLLGRPALGRGHRGDRGRALRHRSGSSSRTRAASRTRSSARPARTTREPYGGGDVPSEHAIRGAWGTTTSVREPEPMDHFLREAFNAEHVASEGAHHQYRLTGAGHGQILELVEEPDLPQGTWHFGEGTIHHHAFDVGTLREPAAREGLHRRPRLHRRLRRQGPRLLLQRLPAHAGRRAVRARLLDRRRASRSTSPRTSSARTCASPRTGRTGAPRSPSSSRSTPIETVKASLALHRRVELALALQQARDRVAEAEAS